MKYQLISDTFDKEQFNKVANHPLQSWQWGEARKNTGSPVVRIGGFEHDKLKEVFTMSLHPIPKLPYRVGYIPRSVLPSEGVLGIIKEYGKENNLILAKFEPDVAQNNNTPLTTHNLQLSPTALFPQWTQVVDLTKSEEDLMAGMKSKTRYNVRYAKKKGVTVYEDSTDRGFEIFSKLYFDTVERQTYHGHDRRYHRLVWDAMKDGIAHILIASYKDEPLAAYELFYFNHTLYYPYGGSSDKYRNLMASNLIMWEAILLGKKLGARSFDMWGSLPPDYDRSKDWAGFTRFKEGYGTKFVQFVESYDLVINPLLYPIYNASYKIRDWLLRKRVL